MSSSNVYKLCESQGLLYGLGPFILSFSLVGFFVFWLVFYLLWSFAFVNDMTKSFAGAFVLTYILSLLAVLIFSGYLCSSSSGTSLWFFLSWY